MSWFLNTFPQNNNLIRHMLNPPIYNRTSHTIRSRNYNHRNKISSLNSSNSVKDTSNRTHQKTNEKSVIPHC